MIASDWKDIGYVLSLIFVLGLVLLLLRRQISEGFEGFTDVIRCDLDSPCPGHLKCLNGFCAKTDPIPKVETNPVPLLPPGSPAPYF